jgi:hypothetical protein
MAHNKHFKWLIYKTKNKEIYDFISLHGLDGNENKMFQHKIKNAVIYRLNDDNNIEDFKTIVYKNYYNETYNK